MQQLEAASIPSGWSKAFIHIALGLGATNVKLRHFTFKSTLKATGCPGPTDNIWEHQHTEIRNKTGDRA